ncbi:MAG: hypothetical protein JWM82_3654 [Myxococcales bacterium]|nr:hypothetical protein [Myxococcales bacterium]
MNQTEGLRSEPLRAALRDALGGRTAVLEDFFARFGGGPDARPNFKLAAAFGDEMAALDDGRAAARLLAHLSADDAAPDTTQVFSPMAAAHGWVGRLRAGHDVEAAWAALYELAADERAPVRASTLAALRAFALVRRGGAELVTRAAEWLDAEDAEGRYSAAAVVLEIFADRQTLATAKLEPLLEYLSRVIAEASDAPRSASRSEGRRRLLVALPRTLTVLAAGGAEAVVTWLEAECTGTKQPEVRAALSFAIGRIQLGSALVGNRVRAALQGSAKPPRDPTRRRPGVGRGKATRETK